MKGPSLIVIFYILSPRFVSSIAAAVDSLSVNQSIADGETIVSANGSYQLGFFSRSNDSSLEKRYLGIWYTFSNETVVWVANREMALNDTSGVLQVTSQGTLTIRNSKNLTIWSSSNATSRQARNPVAQLLETGNLVVTEADDTNEENYLWQSFDYLFDTFLAGAKLGKNFVTGVDNYLVSWKSVDDPSTGDATYRLDTIGYPQVVVAVGGKKVFRSGPWNGFSFGGVSNLRPNSLFSYQCDISTEEVFCEYDLFDKSVFTRMVIDNQGYVQRLNWSSSTRTWNPSLILHMDTCDSYALCGAFGSCNINSSRMCSCLEGFTPKFPLDWGSGNWSGGCVRQKELVCGSGETFQQIDGVKLPDARTSWAIKGLSLSECQTECLKNCSCTAYSTLDISYGTGCLFWRDDLLDIREYDGNGQTFFLRLSSPGQKDTSNRKKIGIVISSVLFALLIMVVVIVYIRKRKSRKHGIMINHNTNFDNEEGKEDMEFGVFDLTTIVNSTEGFSSNNKLGEGGFGPVYKGTLADGQEIAVKRLSKSSGQGMSEFKNEFILIAKLQHRNLVKLLGCCVHGDEKMLVYEFMPNKSLDYFIFGDQSRRKSLHWNKRMVIIEGTARGLLYLHQDSRLRVIHRDLKASNILLDAGMNPKISDFGMARMFMGDQHVAKTKMVVGTYGYIAPEYAVDGLFSTKSDVFSFGVLVLEILSGKRNRGFSHPDHSHNLLGHAWKLWMEERALEVVDNTLDSVFRKSEALRCIHVGLLCVQQRPEDRPNMSSVVLMLSSDNILPEPKQPGFFTERNMPESESSSTNHKSSSMNGMTITLLDAR